MEKPTEEERRIRTKEEKSVWLEHRQTSFEGEVGIRKELDDAESVTMLSYILFIFKITENNWVVLIIDNTIRSVF